MSEGMREITTYLGSTKNISEDLNMNIYGRKNVSRRTRRSYLIGLRHWQESLMLMSLLTLLCVLVLNDASVDEQLLHLLHWLGTNCTWCSVQPY